jgi:hypothetical protein
MRHSLLTILLFVSIISNAQENTSIKTDLLAKAKKQNTAGWVVFGTGFTITSIGLIMVTNEVKNDLYNIFSPEKQKNSSAGTVLAIVGTAGMLSSIPFFLVSSKNQKRAAIAFLKMESQHELKKASFVTSSFPALGLRISL